MQPGDIIVGKFGASIKPRPWLVLWVDDDCVCVAAFSTQGHFPGVLLVKHPSLVPHGFSYATSWVLTLARAGLPAGGPRTAGNIGRAATRQVEAHIASFLDLRK